VGGIGEAVCVGELFDKYVLKIELHVVVEVCVNQPGS